MLKEEELQELERALRAASPAPWRQQGDRWAGLLAPDGAEVVTWGHDEGGITRPEDGAAIAALRNKAPDLIAALREARRLLQSALDHLYETHSCSSDVPQEIAAFLSASAAKPPSSHSKEE